MKKSLLLICTVFCLMGKAQVIPDYNFETWTGYSPNLPVGWGTYGQVTQVSPGHVGSYAVKIQAPADGSQPGAVIYGFPGNGYIFNGGIPFTSRPDSVFGFFKYSIASHDSAWVIVVLKKNGINVSNNIFRITGSNPNNYKRRAFKLMYTGTQTPDSLIIGITSTDPLATISNPQSYIIADDIGFTNSVALVPNAGFENWATVTYSDPTGWTTQNNEDVSTSTTQFPVSRTSDHFAGSSAVQVQNVPQGSGFKPGMLVLGKNGLFRGYPGMAVNFRDSLFTGYIKFAPQNNDTCMIALDMYYQGQLVGAAFFQTDVTLTSWTPFILNIFYNPTFTGIPDSALITICSFQPAVNSGARGNSILKVDNLNFNSLATGICSRENTGETFTANPNPFRSSSEIRFTLEKEEDISLLLYDQAGRKVQVLADSRFSPGEHVLKLENSGLKAGTYLLTLRSDNKSVVKRIVVGE